MNTIERMFIAKCQEPSDINEHLPTLYNLALDCESAAEFGVRSCVSVYALAHARLKKLICVDITRHSNVDEFLSLCSNEKLDVTFHLSDSRAFEMDPVDLIFIDTLHTYTQLSAELAHLGNKSQKYIVFHDTISYGVSDEQYIYPGVNDNITTPPIKTGLVQAIKEFLQDNPQWKEECTYSNNNGLIVLKRIG